MVICNITFLKYCKKIMSQQIKMLIFYTFPFFSFFQHPLFPLSIKFHILLHPLDIINFKLKMPNPIKMRIYIWNILRNFKKWIFIFVKSFYLRKKCMCEWVISLIEIYKKRKIRLTFVNLYAYDFFVVIVSS